ncbi:hypothetical protein LguiA_034412 [Lonicera macranthoides]
MVEVEVPNYTICNFVKDVRPNLSYRRPKTISHMWVFWGQEEEESPQTQTTLFPSCDLDSVTETQTNNRQNVKEYLKSALCNASNSAYTKGPNILIQFWVPTTSVGGRCVLATSNQPFGLYKIERVLCEYRKHSMSHEFNVFQDDEDEFGGNLIGRVFRHKQMESTTDWGSCTTKDYPLRDFALKCGIRRSLSAHTKNHYYGLEFFLPPNWNTISEDSQTFLELLLATVKNQLPGFKIFSGERPCVEVCKISMNDEPDSQDISAQPIPESFANERETVQNEVVVGETVIDNGSIIHGLEQNGIVVSHLEKPVEISRRDSGKELSDYESTVETAIKNESNVLVEEQNKVAVTSLERARRAERKQRTETSFSYVDIEQHFGKKQEDAAESLKGKFKRR